MLFKNLQLFAISPEFATTPGALEAALAQHVLVPCAAAAMESRGWVAPEESGGLVVSLGKQLLVTLGVQQRLLPASVIRQAAKERAAELERQQGFPPGRKQLRDLRERVADELRPRAFVRERRVHGWLDLQHGRLAVDASSPKPAADVGAALRAALGGFPATPLEAEKDVSALLTSWLAAGRAPGRFAIDQDCELIGGEDAQAAVRYVRHDLDGAELRSLIKGGKSVSRLGLNWRERVSFVVTGKLELKRLRFESVDSAAAAQENPADEARDFQAEFALSAGELGEMLNELLAHVGGARPAA
jgi:recombination associated protein RdgC